MENIGTFTLYPKTIKGTLLQYVKVLGVPFSIIVLSILLDLITKSLVENNMRLYQSITVIPKWLDIYYVKNDGAAFSILEGKLIFFVLMTVPALTAMIFCLYYFRNKEMFLKVAIALMIGGTFGNFYDRITIGEVRDFIQIIYGGHDLGVFGTSFAIFNVADMCLTAGIIMLSFYCLFIYVDPKDEKAVKKFERKQKAIQERRNKKASEKVESVEDYLTAKSAITLEVANEDSL